MFEIIDLTSGGSVGLTIWAFGLSLFGAGSARVLTQTTKVNPAVLEYAVAIAVGGGLSAEFDIAKLAAE